MMTMENDGDANRNPPTPRRQCTLFIESDVVMVSRKISAELMDIIGFIEWNRFCDRLDKSLEPIRNLVEQQHDDVIKEQQSAAAKTSALESLQASCDKLSRYMNHNKSIELDYTLYCPFHNIDNSQNNLVNNWHIQLSYNNDGELAQRSALVVEETPTRREGEGQIAPPANDHHPIREQQDTPITTATSTTSEQQQNQQEETTRTSSLSPPPKISKNSFRKGEQLGVLGVDYIEHHVQPNDTLKGICLRYNISAFKLRQTNLLSGENESLLIAPHKILAIPLPVVRHQEEEEEEGNSNNDGSSSGKDAGGGYYSRVQETDSMDYKLNSLRKKFPKLSKKEATAYLELSDWVLEDAVATARDDIEWEKETKDDFF